MCLAITPPQTFDFCSDRMRCAPSVVFAVTSVQVKKIRTIFIDAEQDGRTLCADPSFAPKQCRVSPPVSPFEMKRA